MMRVANKNSIRVVEQADIRSAFRAAISRDSLAEWRLQKSLATFSDPDSKHASSMTWAHSSRLR